MTRETPASEGGTSLRRRLRTWQPPAAYNVVATMALFAATLALSWLAWNYYEYSPWTRDGRVRVYTVQVAPEVSGTVVGLPVRDNQFVHKGDVLFRIDPRTYENSVTQATGHLGQARAQAATLADQAKRRQALSDLAVSAEQRENASGTAEAAGGSVVEAEGQADQAKLNLERTTVRAPVNGWVTNLLLRSGSFATTGQTAMTLVDADSFWVEGYFEETQLRRIAVGDPARVALMAYPGAAVVGRVSGYGRGINVTDAAPGVQGLPNVNPGFTWVRLAQRVPVRIELDDVPCPVVLSSGMTATVTIMAPGDAPQPDARRIARPPSRAIAECGGGDPRPNPASAR